MSFTDDIPGKHKTSIMCLSDVFCMYDMYVNKTSQKRLVFAGIPKKLHTYKFRQ